MSISAVGFQGADGPGTDQGLRLFNSLTQIKESFDPPRNEVGVYVCGITPYDVTHLGHAFTYTVFDVLIRYLRHLGYRVTYVQNLTDIDDDILRKARETETNWKNLAETNTQAFLEDMRWLNNLQPDVYPRSTDHVGDMIEIILKLQQMGHAYTRNGTVYFHLDSFQPYGRLSKLTRQEMLPIASERGNDPKDPDKRDPLDFVLWQAKKPGEPFWPSPWGEGRPGWHIECSAMSMKYLGETLDIHGGGADLIFPHHENSIAQAECATEKPFVRTWMHTGMIQYRGEKMSKSLGNLLLLADLRKSYRPNAIRIAILANHYRSAWAFQDPDLKIAGQRNALFRKVWLAPSGTGSPLDASRFQRQFFDALNDDLNTPLAIDSLHNLARCILQDTDRSNQQAKAFLNKAFNILGLEIEYG
jgi:L-cysteine:1D-myo-inositol 2-amino-2-deoxy-alpha-D-glucopyranoside ligase